jgi:hypothetical protein
MQVALHTVGWPRLGVTGIGRSQAPLATVLPSHGMQLQDSELPVWRQLQQHCESLVEGRDVLQQDEGTAAAAAADGDAATG